tara:strand:+ start:12 stop:1547 length:1536 start_codon:yes stop_codon:yes gene_type:complete
MSDKNLILGARFAAPSFNTGLADTIDKSIKRTTSNLIRQIEGNRRARAAADTRAKNILDKFPEEINFSKLDGIQRDALTPWAFEKKKRAFEIGNLLEETTVGSTEYLTLQNELSNITASYSNANDNLIWVQAKRKEYSENHQRISKGYDAGKKGALDNILLPDELDYTMTYDNFGNPTYNTTHNGKNYSFTKKDFDWFETDDEFSMYLDDLNKSVIKDGIEGINLKDDKFSGLVNSLKRKLIIELDNGGDDRIKSILYDDLFKDVFSDEERAKYEQDPINFKPVIVDKIMKGLIEQNSVGYGTYNPSGGESEFTASMQQKIQLAMPTIQNAINFATQPLNAKERVQSLQRLDIKTAGKFMDKDQLFKAWDSAQKSNDEDVRTVDITPSAYRKLPDEEKMKLFNETYGDDQIGVFYDQTSIPQSNQEDLFRLYARTAGLDTEVINYYIMNAKEGTFGDIILPDGKKAPKIFNTKTKQFEGQETFNELIDNLPEINVTQDIINGLNNIEGNNK